MIVVDIETTGFDAQKCAILSIGAVYFDNPENNFYQEARIDSDNLVNEKALEINGFSQEEIKDPKKQTQKELISNFLDWVEKQEIKILAGHNIGFFDLNFLKIKAEKYKLDFKTRYRSLDLCSVAQTRYFQVHRRFLLDNLQENAMSLTRVLEFCGMRDERKAHNALEDAKLAAECFSRLLQGRSLLPEYKSFPVPDYLKQ